MITIPKEVQIILEQLNQAGHTAYAVGGCVRDSLLGITPLDWDVCTSALPVETKNVFRKNHVIETGIKHGTITVRLNHQSYEVTTFRKDGVYTDYRHPKKVEFVSDINDDLSRRDFTVNAMAYHPKVGLVDIFQGQIDLNNRMIRCVGDGKKRFQEDALRIMRGLRFAAVYGFSMEEKTKEAMFHCKDLLSKIAVERIQVEFNKLLVGDAAESILLEYRDIFAQIIPEFIPMFDMDQKTPHHSLDVWEHTVKSLGCADKILIVRLAVLFHDIGKPQTFFVDKEGSGHFYSHATVGESLCEKILRRLKYDNKTINSVTELVRCHDVQIESTPKAVKKQLNKLGAEQFERLLLVKEADVKTTNHAQDKLNKIEKLRSIYQAVLEENSCFSLKDLAITGADLIACGIPKGKRIGETLQELLELVIENQLENTKECLLDFLKNR